MANHSLESFSGGKYGFSPDAALYPNYDYVFAAEQHNNPTEALVTKLGRTAVGWLRRKTKIFSREHAAGPADAETDAYTPTHAVVTEPVNAPYVGRHRAPTLQANPVHRQGYEGVYRSAHAAETAPTLAEQAEEANRIRDAIILAKRGRHAKRPTRHFSKSETGRHRNEYPSFQETLPPAVSISRQRAPANSDGEVYVLAA